MQAVLAATRRAGRPVHVLLPTGRVSHGDGPLALEIHDVRGDGLVAEDAQNCAFVVDAVFVDRVGSSFAMVDLRVVIFLSNVHFDIDLSSAARFETKIYRNSASCCSVGFSSRTYYFWSRLSDCFSWILSAFGLRGVHVIIFCKHTFKSN